MGILVTDYLPTTDDHRDGWPPSVVALSMTLNPQLESFTMMQEGNTNDVARLRNLVQEAIVSKHNAG